VTSPEPQATILVVDDDEAMRDLLRRMLERAGFMVVTAIHGRDALERFRSQQTDAVVTDMVMPEMDGIELIRALLAERPRLPIIAVSGVDDWANYLRMAIDLGAKVGMQKPVRAGELARTVRQILSQE
jgi:DNA-binding NtrC family response regulator